MQQVYVSHTQTGQLGLFTNGFLVFTVTAKEVFDKATLQATCAKWQLELIENPRQ